MFDPESLRCCNFKECGNFLGILSSIVCEVCMGVVRCKKCGYAIFPEDEGKCEECEDPLLHDVSADPMVVPAKQNVFDRVFTAKEIAHKYWGNTFTSRVDAAKNMMSDEDLPTPEKL